MDDFERDRLNAEADVLRYSQRDIDATTAMLFGLPTKQAWFEFLLDEKRRRREQGVGDHEWPAEGLVGFETGNRSGAAVHNAVDAKLREHMHVKKVERELEERLGFISDYGEDNFTDLDVLKFAKRFVKDGKLYSYAAIKVDGLWYTTGPKSPKGFTWDELVLWLVSSVPTLAKDVVLLEREGTDLTERNE